MLDDEPVIKLRKSQAEQIKKTDRGIFSRVVNEPLKEANHRSVF